MKFPLEVYTKGRGAQVKVPNRFDSTYKELHSINGKVETKYIPVYPKTIVNKVPSPDLKFDWSMNPYQGCEHGCVYCYARPTHSFWGYGPGVDFESRIMVKKNAPHLLRQVFKSKNWKASPIMVSGNTDCYQPAERKYELTRRLLEVCWEFRHPVCLITKNSMITRDLDILEKLAKHNLTKVVISITGMDEEVRRVMEPRTSTYQSRLNTLHALSKVGIPTYVMMAPVIPSINDHEIFTLAKEIHRRGALDLFYTMVRLNDEVGVIFKDWLQKNFPNRFERVINQIESIHGGVIENKKFGSRFRGEGKWAEVFRSQFDMVKRKCFANSPEIMLNLDLYDQFKNPQMTLF